jgi:hypothetical protein
MSVVGVELRKKPNQSFIMPLLNQQRLTSYQSKAQPVRSLVLNVEGSVCGRWLQADPHMHRICAGINKKTPELNLELSLSR